MNTIVILCAGKSSRIKKDITLNNTESLSNDIEINDFKPLIKYKGKPLIQYTIDFWKKYCNNFVFVVGYRKQAIIDYINQTADYEYSFVIQKEQKGIADAISVVQSIIKKKSFLVVLADCICTGDIINFPKEDSIAIGAYATDNADLIQNGYSVEQTKDIVWRVQEKPKDTDNKLCGLGYYYFTSKVFDYIAITPPSSIREEVEITDVIQIMIDSGEVVNCFYLEGEYININYLDDLKSLANFL